MKSGNHRSRLFFFRIIHSLTPNTSSVKYSWISRKTWGKRFLHNDVFSPQVLAGAIARTCEDGCKYLRERLPRPTLHVYIIYIMSKKKKKDEQAPYMNKPHLPEERD